MRILAVNQFYRPDNAATAQLLTQLCEDLVAGGDEVTVVASRGAYLGGGQLPAREFLSGVEVVRPWSTRLGKRTNAHRVSDYLSFWASSVLQLAIERQPDVILALSTPPMIAAGAGAVAASRRIPLVTWVQDVYPEAAVALGALSPSHPLVAALRLVSTATHRMSRTTVVLSETMGKRVAQQGQSRARIRVVHNWSDGAVVRPIAHDDNPFRREHVRPGQFLVTYSGNLGKGHDLTTLVNAARALDERHPHIQCLFIGDGVRRVETERMARGLSNVRFLPYQPFSELAASLSAADIHLVSLREGLEGLLVPSKLYGILAAGRPVMFVGPPESEVARVVTEHEVGWAGRPGDSVGLARAIEAAASDPHATAVQGERARALFEERFERRVAVANWRRVLHAAND